MLLQQLQDGGKHDVRSVQAPNKIQMLPVINVLMEDQVRHLQTQEAWETVRQTGAVCPTSRMDFLM